MAGSSFTVFALAAVAMLVALTGVVLIWQGGRGRRIGSAPACRRCNYDLSGREGGAAPIERCPECGTSLLPRRAVARGVRRRSGRRAAVGVAAFLLGIAGVTFSIGPRIVATDWITKVPTTVLLWGEGLGTDRWRFEIADRIGRGDVNERSTRRLVDRLLARLEAVHEADRRDGLPPGTTLGGGVALGELAILESASMTRSMSDAQIGRWVEMLMTGLLSVAVEPEWPAGRAYLAKSISRGDGTGVVTTRCRPLFIIRKSTPPTSGNIAWLGGQPIRVVIRIDEAHGPTLDSSSPVGCGSTMSLVGSARSGSVWNAQLRAGRHQLDAVGSVSVHALTAESAARLQARRGVFHEAEELSEEIHRWSIRLPLTIEVVEAPRVVVTPVADPALRDAVRAAIRIERGADAIARHLGGRGAQDVRGADGTIVISVDRSTPVPICMLVFIRSGERETMLGLLCPSQHLTMPLIVQEAELRLAAREDAETVDLVLRPAADTFGERLADRLGASTYWNEEIIIEGVPIDAPRGETE